MGIKETHSVDKNSGKITQTNYTEERSDGKTETRHLNPDSGKYTGKSVHDTQTGKTEYYTREEANMGSCCYITTACLDAMNIPQGESLELKAMKIMTKEHILKSMQGKRDYVRYNRKAPRIVSEIEARSDSKQIWGGIYERLQDMARFVFIGKYEEGYQSYKSLVNELDTQLLQSGGK